MLLVRLTNKLCLFNHTYTDVVLLCKLYVHVLRLSLLHRIVSTLLQ